MQETWERRRPSSAEKEENVPSWSSAFPDMGTSIRASALLSDRGIRAGALLSDLGTVYFVAFFKKEFGKIRSILAGNSGNKSNLHWMLLWFFKKSLLASRSPSSSETLACQPRLLRRVLSISFLGVPSGFVGSNSIAPS